MRDKEEEGPIFFGGVITGCVLTGFISSIAVDANWIQWAYAYENLASGILASFAATFTSIILVWQIKNARDLAYRERQAKLAASRSTLPLALSEFSSYARRSLALSLDMCLGIETNPVIPSTPDGHLETFQNCIAHADQENRQRLSKLLMEYQVQHSRLQNAIREYRPHPRGEQYSARAADNRALSSGGHVYSSALLVCMIQELYAFARDSSRDLVEGSRAERISGIFAFLEDGRGSYYAEDWPVFIGHFMRMADRDIQ